MVENAFEKIYIPNWRKLGLNIKMFNKTNTENFETNLNKSICAPKNQQVFQVSMERVKNQ